MARNKIIKDAEIKICYYLNYFLTNTHIYLLAYIRKHSPTYTYIHICIHTYIEKEKRTFNNRLWWVFHFNIYFFSHG